MGQFYRHPGALFNPFLGAKPPAAYGSSRRSRKKAAAATQAAK